MDAAKMPSVTRVVRLRLPCARTLLLRAAARYASFRHLLTIFLSGRTSEYMWQLEFAARIDETLHIYFDLAVSCYHV